MSSSAPRPLLSLACERVIAAAASLGSASGAFLPTSRRRYRAHYRSQRTKALAGARRAAHVCLLFASGSTLLPFPQALAWGAEGHSIIGELAQRRLTPAAQRRVTEILGGNISLASIASWADDMRTLVPKTYNWHFVDIPLNASNYDPARDCQQSPRGDCIISALERNQKTLLDPTSSVADRREALKYLVHFIGDLHQPLHTVKDYAGGNKFAVSYFVDAAKKRTEPTNLHFVWDTGLIRSTVWNWGNYVTRLEEQWLPGQNLELLSSGTLVEWALAAHQAAIDVAFTIEPNAQLGEDYLAIARPTVDRQLALAGLRLARTLNDTFK